MHVSFFVFLCVIPFYKMEVLLVMSGVIFSYGGDTFVESVLFFVNLICTNSKTVIIISKSISFRKIQGLYGIMLKKFNRGRL